MITFPDWTKYTRPPPPFPGSCQLSSPSSPPLHVLSVLGEKEFIPAYKATRIIAEVTIESIPQCGLQSYIFWMVVTREKAGTLLPNDVALLDGAELLPKSVLISLLASLKTWIELVVAARQAGLSVPAKLQQLWEVGAGLPLDALKKGSITNFKCPYRIAPEEVQPLIDALIKNSSLVHLDLTLSGLTWTGANANGAPLFSAMATKASTLGGLQTLILSPSGYTLPIGELRAGTTEALEALRRLPFYSPDGGPRREEINLMADLLRQNQSLQAEAAEVKEGDKASKLLEAASAGKIKKDAWQKKVTQFMVDGRMRRAHIQNLISPFALRLVGFSARQLRSVDFTLQELHDGSYLAAELRAIGCTAADLKAVDYTAAELHEGGYDAGELKPLGYNATELRDAKYEAVELRSVGFLLSQLRAAGYNATDLKAADYSGAELKKVH